LIERLGFAEIQTVYRQKEQWQREATVAYSAGRISKGLGAYAEKNCIHFGNDEKGAMSLLVADWFNLRKSCAKELNQYLVIAHRNNDVNQLNQLIRIERVRRGEIAEGYRVNSKVGNLKISSGDRLLFLKNDRALGVANGRFASIKSVEFTELGEVTAFTVILDGTNKEITVNPNAYSDFAHGYSATVHKVQGLTVDHALVYSGGYFWNRNLTYVAMSRHRDTCALYIDGKQDINLAATMKRLSRLGMKDSLLDFPKAFAERRGLDVSGALTSLPKKLISRLVLMKDKLMVRIENIFAIEKDLQKVEANAGVALPTPISFTTREIQQMSLNQLLLEYVNMEIEQASLVHSKHSTASDSLKNSKGITEKSVANRSNIRAFANAAMQHPGIKSEIEKIKGNKIATLAMRGGFKAIQERMREGSPPYDDVQILICQLKARAFNKSLSQDKIQDRGGRSR
jgi:hypothetical protein